MEDNMCKWDKFKKPPQNFCPQKFCFIWSEEDNNCSESFGSCSRNTGYENQKDWYEPCEPELERYGLPWFYFITSPDKLIDELKEDYIRESNTLWGNS